MAQPRYIANDPWVIDSITGFRIRKSDSVEQWDGNVVHRSYAEPRHPQDYVRARKEDIAVENARPPVPDMFIGPLQTTVTARVEAGGTSIPVVSSNGFEVGDRVSLMLADGDTFRTAVATVPDTTTITVTPALPGAIAINAVITDNTAMAEAVLP